MVSGNCFKVIWERNMKIVNYGIGEIRFTLS